MSNERIEAGAGANFKNIKGGNPMEIGDKGYLIEVGTKGIREDKWLKPPLYERFHSLQENLKLGFEERGVCQGRVSIPYRKI